ncbi:MAG TPA: hypothetical protein VF476_18300 [Chitinophagaceae bacterium]
MKKILLATLILSGLSYAGMAQTPASAKKTDAMAMHKPAAKPAASTAVQTKAITTSATPAPKVNSSTTPKKGAVIGKHKKVRKNKGKTNSSSGKKSSKK